MALVETVTLYRGEERVIVRADDVQEWMREGWRTERTAPEAPATEEVKAPAKKKK